MACAVPSQRGRHFIALTLTLAVSIATAHCTLNELGTAALPTGDAGLGGAAGADGAQADRASEADVARDQAPADVIKPQDSGGCFPGTKLCGECVVTESPDFGCSADTCTPCSAPHAVPGCANESCSIASCEKLFRDCNGKYLDGCETPVNTLDNCHDCGTPCLPAHAKGDCTTGDCAVASCDPNWKDCDGSGVNGCEANLLTNPKNCGTCGNDCSKQSTTDKMTCKNGVCVVDLCATGTADCDTDPKVCEVNLTNDPLNCGACGIECTFTHGQGACIGGQCQLVACDGTYKDCNSIAADGCEVDTSQNTTHCGSCGGTCSTHQGTQASCVQGLCFLTCLSGFDNCNGAQGQPGNSSLNDGCEVSIKTDSNHCGGCGDKCSLANASKATCVDGKCELVCNTGFADCDGPAPGEKSTGCESNLATNVLHCGTCETACNSTHGTASCSNGVCGLQCTAPWSNCDSDLSNGCEANLQTEWQHCGSCSTTCNNNNGTPVCTNGSCTIDCTPPWENCDKILSNGCETNLNTSVQHCGTCATVCGNNHATPTCNTGVCALQCGSGYANCDSNAATGCEADLLNDLNHCGSCSTVCGNAHASPDCNAGTCVLNCTGDYEDCDGLSSNGCEINLASDASHCGSCTKVCAGGANATATCVGSLCGLQCASGWGNCDSNPANGCETPTTSDPSHCGSCQACAIGSDPHGTATCSNGACGITCSGTYYNCNNNLADGCEANLQNDPKHCGLCPISCPTLPHTTPKCVSGLCSFDCVADYGNCDGLGINGCEVNLNTDVDHCGTCATDCPQPAHTVPHCNVGKCGTPTCVNNYGDCNNNMADGCETYLLSNNDHCGSCGNKCTGSKHCNAQGQCV